MPPLVSVSEVTHAVTEEERLVCMQQFQDGSVAYVKAHDTDTRTTHNLFLPRSMDYHHAVFGLMIDGVVKGAARGEYFADKEVYVQHLDAERRVLDEDTDAMAAVSYDRRRTIGSRLLNKILGR